MDCKDLMVGDFFTLVDFNSPICINAIYDDMVQTQANYQSEIDGNWYSEAEIKDLVPIELTEDILVKNGWDFTKRDYSVYCKEDTNGDAELSKDQDGFYWSINCDEYMILRIDYVHQLQHLMRLCGIEKEIEL